MSMPLPPIPQKTGHAIYGAITAGVWFVLNPILFLGAASMGSDGVALLILTFVLGFGAPLAWIIRSIQVSAVNRRNANNYMLMLAQYNAHQQQWYPR